MTHRKRCVLVGAGPRGAMLARALTDHPDLVLAGVCDPSPASVAAFTAEFPGVPVFADIAGLLSGTAADLAIVATPPRRHAEDSIALIERGVPTIVECPMVETFDEAEAVHAAAVRSGVPVAMAESFCFLPAVQSIRKVVQERRAEGTAGLVLGGEGHYLEMDSGMIPGGWRDDYRMARYITHGLGPLLYATGQRAHRVIGLDPLGRRSRAQGSLLPIALVETDGGAVFYVANSGLAPRPLTRWTVTAENWCAESDPAGAFDGPLRIFHGGPGPAGGDWEQREVSLKAVYDDLWGLGFEPERLMLRRFAAELDGAEPALGLGLSLNISLAGVAAAASGERDGAAVVLPSFEPTGAAA
ncbi:putative dehydrogenase [Allocatelliglobosispora scoriae]|uniref:Putative dehydrogenase n=1 Tax=Allocatelliglobosispora scoriae TaxID=643052 RepID=A0A841BL21_9ACTN|nr:Gfo/Idh/MocA family oxidoreductase [Allocatelliglobosispora scoriae]MBB5868335.1 putative dehydrogenase [Allocatelliglobosispora scoriae]